MTNTEALRLCRQYHNISIPTEEDDFTYTEALRFLMEETKDPGYMMDLGGFYYGRKKYDLALKYYELAAEYNYEGAFEGLGYIWYYGRTGQKDYEKAFYYYSKAAELGNIVCQYKVADMYKNGYSVEKNYEKYKEIIEDLFPKVQNARSVYDPVPEIYTRLARIRTEEGEIYEAVRLYLIAKNFLAQRISYSPFFGNLNIMKWLIEALYELIEFPEDGFDFYDLYYLLLKPVTVTFRYKKAVQKLQAVEEDGEVVICFNGKWYRTVDDFFQKAHIGDVRLTEVYDELKRFRIVETEEH